MRFVFNFSALAPEHPVLISGTAESLEEAKFMFRTGVKLYGKQAGYKKSVIKKLLQKADLVEPEILNEYEWTIDLLMADDILEQG